MAPDSASLATTSRISSALAQRIGRHSYDMWFAGTTRLAVEGDRLEVAANSGFVADWIGHRFRGDLDSVARETLGDRAHVDVLANPELFEPALPGRGAPPRRSAARSVPARHALAGRPTSLRRFEDFIGGPSNRLALLAAQRLAEEGSDASPLFIHGECGVGKTHLLQGVVRRAAGGRQAARYMTAEQFTNEYITSVRAGNLERMRKRLRKLDLLAVDDVHFVANKTATQNELQHTIDAITLAGGRAVFASDDHPRHLGFAPALGSRLVAGMVARIERPDRELRMKLLHRLAGARGFALTDGAADAIAAKCIGSVRELEGATNKLAALRLVEGAPDGEPVGMLLVERLFADTSWQPRNPVRLNCIVDAVCRRLVVERVQLLSAIRHRRVVTARGLVAYLARELTTLSYPEIAQALGRKHHSTVHTAVRRVTNELKERRHVVTGDHGETVPLPELVDQLRHRILKDGKR